MKNRMFLMIAVLAVTSMVLAACGPAPTEAPAATEAPAPAPAASEAPAAPAYEGMTYEAPNCDYGGIVKYMKAVDEFTFELGLCVPDPAVPQKLAFTSFTIQPSEYLESTGGTGDLLEKPIGTGPYKVEAWERGNQLVLTANEDYWGEKPLAKTLVFRWGTESAQRLLELQSGTVDAIDNLGPEDFATVEGDSTLQLIPRQALNIMYFGFNNNPKAEGFDNTKNPFANEKVRQAVAMGIDRKRIVDQFYPPGSSVATHFTPCAIANGCVGDDWYEFDVEAAKALLAEAGYPDGFDTVINFRDVARSYVAQPAAVVQDLQAQLKTNLNINATIEVMESGAFLDAADSGILTGIYLLGWGADYPDQTNFLDYHFGASASPQFGDPFDDITSNLKQAAQLSSDDARKPFYEAANNAIKQHVPMVPIAWGGSAIAAKAGVSGLEASPLNDEQFAPATSGADTLVWMQNAEPISLYCPDETDGESLRACGQINEALLGFKTGTVVVEPDLAESYEANDDLTVWTFHLRQGVKFHDGSSFDANDVVTSLALQWDAAHPLHTGNTGGFTYWTSLWGGFLNPPAQ